jgi:hypothetical protein
VDVPTKVDLDWLFGVAGQSAHTTKLTNMPGQTRPAELRDESLPKREGPGSSNRD